jgi:hypothetical protein
LLGFDVVGLGDDPEAAIRDMHIPDVVMAAETGLASDLLEVNDLGLIVLQPPATKFAIAVRSRLVLPMRWKR